MTDRPERRDEPGAGHRYRFRVQWRLDAAPDGVFDVLADLARYPRWWPQIRDVQVHDERAAQVRIRSFLPYTLAFELQRSIMDRERGVLVATMTGDLAGRSSWEIRGDGGGSRLRFHEEATVERPILRRLEPLARPAFIANHSWMMRGCRRGLVAALAGYEIAGDGGPAAPGV